MRKEEARAGVARPGSVSSSGIAAAGPSGKDPGGPWLPRAQPLFPAPLGFWRVAA